MNRINDWEKQILTAQDIARIFKCGKNLAYKIIESDDMNAVRIGSTIRVSMKSFNEWINNKGFLLNNEETFDNQVYTLEEIKDILKIGTTSLPIILSTIGRNSSYNLLNENYFKIIKLGKIVRISKKSFDNWLNK